MGSHVPLLALMTIALLHCHHCGGIIALVMLPLPSFDNVISFCTVVTDPFFMNLLVLYGMGTGLNLWLFPHI